MNYKLLQHIIIATVCFLHAFTLAQTPNLKLNYISKLKPIYVDSVKRINADTIVYLRFEFAKAVLLNPQAIKPLKDRTITGIDLVYSTHIESETFDQYKLNLERLENLKKAAEFLFENDNLRWRIIGETKFETNADAQRLFSGFILHLRPKMSAVETEAEIKMLDEILEGKEMPIETVRDKAIQKQPTEYSYKMYCHDFNKEKNTFIFGGSRVKLNNEIKKKPKIKGGDNSFYKLISETVKFEPDHKFKRKQKYCAVYSFEINKEGLISNAKVKSSTAPPALNKMVIDCLMGMKPWSKTNLNNQKLLYNFTVIFGKEKVRVPYSNFLTNVLVGNLAICDVLNKDTTKSKIIPRSYFIPDSTIIKILTRNKKWKKMLLVADLTGSMYVYTAQLLLWFQLKQLNNESPISHITFFNDGDDKNTYEKPIGNAGGIYNSTSTDFDEIVELAKTTMRKGNGGDGPENNLEAVINGINACNDCSDVILIADNQATPRDLSLVNKINKPIKLVLCGTRYGINPNYLDFVRENKGSLHTIESDILNLIINPKNQQIEIEGIKYMIKDGHFRRVY